MNRGVFFALLVTCCATSIFAQASRTYVSSHGSDTNVSSNCGDQLNPCRLLQTAHDHTNAGGAIMVLDSAFYGPLNITKAMNVIASEGLTVGIIAPANGNAVTVNPGSTDVVRLNNINIIGGGNAGATGILISGGLRTEVKFSSIQDVKYGIKATQDTRVFLDHVTISGFTDGAGGGIGIWSNTPNPTNTSTMKFFLGYCHLIGGDLGVKVDGGAFSVSGSNGDQNQIYFTTSSWNVASAAFQNCTTVLNFNFNGSGTGGPAGNGTCNAP